MLEWSFRASTAGTSLFCRQGTGTRRADQGQQPCRSTVHVDEHEERALIRTADPRSSEVIG